jgi:hypothetical protein
MTTYFIEVGINVPSVTLGEPDTRECIAEVGPFDSLLSAKNTMRSLVGKRAGDALDHPKGDTYDVDPTPENRSRVIQGFTIAFYSDEVGTFDNLHFDRLGLA